MTSDNPIFSYIPYEKVADQNTYTTVRHPSYIRFILKYPIYVSAFQTSAESSKHVFWTIRIIEHPEYIFWTSEIQRHKYDI